MFLCLENISLSEAVIVKTIYTLSEAGGQNCIDLKEMWCVERYYKSSIVDIAKVNKNTNTMVETSKRPISLDPWPPPPEPIQQTTLPD